MRDLSTISFTIHGKPKGKQRARMTKAGITYTPKETRDYESVVREIAATKFPEPFSGPVRLSIKAFFEMPKSWSKKKRAEMLGMPHTQTPDLDNIEKAVTDGMNRISFFDDKQVYAKDNCIKVWSELPGKVIVSATEVGRGNPEE